MASETAGLGVILDFEQTYGATLRKCNTVLHLRGSSKGLKISPS